MSLNNIQPVTTHQTSPLSASDVAFSDTIDLDYDVQIHASSLSYTHISNSDDELYSMARDNIKKAFNSYDSFVEDIQNQGEKLNAFIETVNGDLNHLGQGKDGAESFAVIRYDKLFELLSEFNLYFQIALSLLRVMSEKGEMIAKAAIVLGATQTTKDSVKQIQSTFQAVQKIHSGVMGNLQEMQEQFQESVEEYNATLYQKKIQSIEKKYTNFQSSLINFIAANDSDIQKLKEKQKLNEEYGKAIIKTRNYYLRADIEFQKSSDLKLMSEFDVLFKEQNRVQFKGTKLLDVNQRVQNPQYKSSFSQSEMVEGSQEEPYDALLKEQRIDYDPQNWKDQNIPSGLIPYHDEKEPGAHFFAFDAQGAADALVAFEKYALVLKTGMIIMLSQVQMLDKASSNLDDALPIDNTVYAQSDIESLQSHLGLAQKRLQDVIGKNKQLANMANQHEKIRISLMKMGGDGSVAGVLFRVFQGLKNLGYIGLAASFLIPVAPIQVSVFLGFGLLSGASELINSALQLHFESKDQKMKEKHLLDNDGALKFNMRIFSSEYGVNQVDNVDNSESAVKQKLGCHLKGTVSVSQMMNHFNEIDQFMVDLHEASIADIGPEAFSDDNEVFQHSDSLFVKIGGQKIMKHQVEIAEMKDRFRLMQERTRLMWFSVTHLSDVIQSAAAMMGDSQKKSIRGHLTGVMQSLLGLSDSLVGLQYDALEIYEEAKNHNVDVEKNRFESKLAFGIDMLRFALYGGLVLANRVFFIPAFKVFMDFGKDALKYDSTINKYSLQDVDRYKMKELDVNQRYDFFDYNKKNSDRSFSSTFINGDDIRNQFIELEGAQQDKYLQALYSNWDQLSEEEKELRRNAEQSYMINDDSFENALGYYARDMRAVLSDVYQMGNIKPTETVAVGDDVLDNKHAVFQQSSLIEDGSKLFWDGAFVSGFNGSGKKEYMLNFKAFQQARERIKKRAFKAQMALMATMLKWDRITKAIHIDGGNGFEMPFNLMKGVLDRDMMRQFDELGLIKSLQIQEMSDLNQQFQRLKKLEKNMMEVVAVGASIGAGALLNQSSVISKEFVQIEILADMIQGIHYAYGDGSKNKLDVFVNEKNTQHYQSLEDAKKSKGQESLSSSFDSTGVKQDHASKEDQSQDQLTPTRQDWQIDIINSEIQDVLGWSHKMINYTKVVEAHLEFRDEKWGFIAQLRAIKGQAEVLAKAVSCLGGTTQSLAFTQIVDTLIKQDKQVKQSVLEDDVAIAKAHQNRFMTIQKERLETVTQLLKLVVIKFFVAPFFARLTKWSTRGVIPRSGNRLRVKATNSFNFVRGLPFISLLNTDQLFEFYRLGFHLSRAKLIEQESELKFSQEHQRAINQKSKVVNNELEERRFRLFDIENQLIKLKFEKAYAKSITESLSEVQANWNQFSAIFQANFIVKPINNLRQSLKDLTKPGVYEAFASSRMQHILHSNAVLMDSLSELRQSLIQPKNDKQVFKSAHQNLLRVPRLVATTILDPRSHEKRALSHRIFLKRSDLVYGFHLNSKIDSLIKHLEAQIKSPKYTRNESLDSDLKKLNAFKLDLNDTFALKDFKSIEGAFDSLQDLLKKIKDITKIEHRHMTLKDSSWKERVGSRKGGGFQAFQDALEGALIRMHLAAIFQRNQNDIEKKSAIKRLKDFANDDAQKLTVAKCVGVELGDQSIFKSDLIKPSFESLDKHLKVTDDKDVEYTNYVRFLMRSMLVADTKAVDKKLDLLSHMDPENRSHLFMGYFDKKENQLESSEMSLVALSRSLSASTLAPRNQVEDAYVFGKKLFSEALYQKWINPVNDKTKLDDDAVNQKQIYQKSKQVGEHIAMILEDQKTSLYMQPYDRLKDYLFNYRPQTHIKRESSNQHLLLNRSLDATDRLRSFMSWLAKPRLHSSLESLSDGTSSNVRSPLENKPKNQKVDLYLKDLAKQIRQSDGKQLAIIQALGVSESLHHMAGKESMVDQEIAIHLTDIEAALKHEGISIKRDKTNYDFVGFEDTNELFNGESKAVLSDLLNTDYKKALNDDLDLLLDQSSSLKEKSARFIKLCSKEGDGSSKQEISAERVKHFAKAIVERHKLDALITTLKNMQIGKDSNPKLVASFMHLCQVMQTKYRIELFERLFLRQNIINQIHFARKTYHTQFKSLIKDKSYLFEIEDQDGLSFLSNKINEIWWNMARDRQKTMMRPFRYGYDFVFSKQDYWESSMVFKQVENMLKSENPSKQQLAYKFLTDKINKSALSVNKKSELMDLLQLKKKIIEKHISKEGTKHIERLLVHQKVIGIKHVTSSLNSKPFEKELKELEDRGASLDKDQKIKEIEKEVEQQAKTRKDELQVFMSLCDQALNNSVFSKLLKKAEKIYDKSSEHVKPSLYEQTLNEAYNKTVSEGLEPDAEKVQKLSAITRHDVTNDIAEVIIQMLKGATYESATAKQMSPGEPPTGGFYFA